MQFPRDRLVSVWKCIVRDPPSLAASAVSLTYSYAAELENVADICVNAGILELGPTRHAGETPLLMVTKFAAEHVLPRLLQAESFYLHSEEVPEGQILKKGKGSASR